LNVLRGTWDVKRAILWIGGDIMEGWIHPGEGMPENFMSPSEEMYFAFEQLTSVIQYILAEYGVDQLRVVMSAGNHGRSTVKKQSNDFRTSYEYLMYRFIRHSLRNESRVECVLSEGYETFEDVYGLRIAFHHGDKVKYGGGVGGIYPSLYRRIHRISDGAFHRNLDVLGHHHQLSFGQGAFVNGSLIGLTAYAAGEGFRPEPPQQGSFLVDAKHKVPVAQFPIFVGEK
jgi:hypothetical protein